MAHIFEIEDKSGRKVHLSNERWQHIAIEHPTLSGKIEEIKDTILNPTSIKKSKYNENVRFYFKLFKEMSKYLWFPLSI